MALLAESLVEEWLNRQGFFTIRGIKHGVDEIDILAVRPAKKGLEAWHAEVQGSFRPIGYISKLPKAIADKSGKGRASAAQRSPNLLKECVDGWVETQFLSDKKARARERAWPALSWQHYLVHAVARDNSELALIAKRSVGLIPFHTVLHGLCLEAATDFKGAAGSDIAEMIGDSNDNIGVFNNILQKAKPIIIVKWKFDVFIWSCHKFSSRYTLQNTLLNQ